MSTTKGRAQQSYVAGFAKNLVAEKVWKVFAALLLVLSFSISMLLPSTNLIAQQSNSYEGLPYSPPRPGAVLYINRWQDQNHDLPEVKNKIDIERASNGNRTDPRTDDGPENNTPEVNEDSGDRSSNSQTRRSSRQDRRRFDPQLVSRGEAAFQDACTQCHDAERSLEKRKTRAAWLATVRRMARMDDADIDSSDIVPIATYLASLSQPQNQSSGTDSDGTGSGGDSGDGETESDGDGMNGGSEEDLIDEELANLETFGSGLSISGTISPQWRGGNDNLENPGFFVDAWMRADWQPSGPIRGRVTTCTSCHSDQTNNGGFTLELVEATATLDLLHWYKEKDRRPEHCRPKIDAELRAGRFVVPFGAFAGMSHPGIYRTVTNPLMYNMGRQVNDDRSIPPVLPSPYSDEGIDFFVKLGVTEKIDATMNLYGVNGLQGSSTGIRFTPSRSYSDNNDEPALGGRATIGSNRLRFGGSVMSGQLQSQGALPLLNYRYTGADVTSRFFDNMIRLYFEYAIRTNETIFPEDQIAYGTVTEVEALLLDKPNISALARYDTLEHRNQSGGTSIERFTWGLSTTAFGGSLFMVNHEHWHFSTAGRDDVDVLGVRWVATF